MAEGLSNAAIASRLFLSEGAISKYTTTIFAKLGLAADDDTNRRVRAVLAYLGADAQAEAALRTASRPPARPAAVTRGRRGELRVSDRRSRRRPRAGSRR